MLKKNCKCLTCGKRFHLKTSAVLKGRGKYCSKSCFTKAQIGRKMSKAQKNNIRKALLAYNIKNPVHYNTGRIAWNKDKKCPQLSGKNSSNWKGGITSETMKIRNSLEYKKWVRDVFERDNYTCALCGKRGGDLEAHHIKPFSQYKNKRLNLFNGITLCKECHRMTKNSEKMWENYLYSNLFNFNYGK